MSVPVINFPPFRPYSNITPFTVRDGATYLTVLEELRNWLNTTLVPHVDTEVANLVIAWEDNATTLLANVITALNEQNDTVTAQLNAQNAAILAQLNDQNTAITAQLAAQDADVAAQISAMTAYVDNAVQSIINSTIEISDPVIHGVISNTASISYSDIINIYASLFDNSAIQFAKTKSSQYFVDSYSGATDAEKIQNAVNDAISNGGGKIIFSAREYIVNSPILWYKQISFIGAGSNSGNNDFGTIITYTGPDNTALFTFDKVNNNGSNWFTRTFIENIKAIGPGKETNTSFYDASDDISPDFLNVAGLSFNKLVIDGFDKGIVVDGYGHHFQEITIRNCTIGFDLVHPEQTLIINCWTNYCDIGIVTNHRRIAPAHDFTIIGGSYQRGIIGMDIRAIYELNLTNVYFELNTETDIYLGDVTDGSNYTKGVKNADINGISFTGAIQTVSNMSVYASNSIVISGNFAGNAERNANGTVPNVYVNGYCKNIDILYNPDQLNNPNIIPFVFAGESRKRSWAHTADNQGYPNIFSVDSGLGITVVSPINVRKTSGSDIRISGSFDSDNTVTGNITLFTLPTELRPNTVLIFPVSMMNKTTFEISTGHIRVNNTGAVIWRDSIPNVSVTINNISYTL